MLAERPLHNDVRELLLNHEPFQYAHLIKFERPTRPASNSGQASTSKQRYTYITDASRDVPFNDGSVDLAGNANGEQTYVANKVLRVSAVQEDTEAKASSYALVLDGNGLGALISENVAITSPETGIYDLAFPSYVDLLSYGFREGDKVNLRGTINGNANIRKFRAANVVRVSVIDAALAGGSGTTTMSLSSDEIVSILQDKSSSNYASFINREVFIYRTYFQNGNMVGAPFLLFKGIISGVGFDDDDNALTVTWNLTSHWGDFSQVKGRITSDDFHRALDQNGIPQPQSALKVSYAYDKGFSHAETSVNILAQYSVQVEKQDVKVKKGFLGIGSKVKVKKYYVSEGRNTELDFQLQAKAIPIIYGVRNTAGIPIFADTLKDDSSTVYVIQALSEGEIGGIYDAYVDGSSLICNSKSDFDLRSTQTSTDNVQLICRGRADRGDVLGGVASVATTTPIPFYQYYYSDPEVRYRTILDYDMNWLQNYQEYIEPTIANTDTTGAGIVDGQSINLTSPQEFTLDVFSGKPGQKAASSLVTIAAANNFKIQADYWNGKDTTDYWGPNHRLMDTAYVVGKYKIKEGETSIPTVDYIVRGKTINCYNYDKSYTHYSKASGEQEGNFNLGDFVSLQKTDGTVLVASTQIIDKWTFRNTDGTPNTRFRFSIDPPLNYVNGVPGITQFRMNKNGATWTMITYNFKELEQTNAVESTAQVTGAYNNNGFVLFTFSGGAGFGQGGDPQESSGVFSILNNDGTQVDAMFFANAVLVGTVNNNSLLTKFAWSVAGPAATSLVGKNLVRRNSVNISGGGDYVGYDVTLSRQDMTTGRRNSQTRKIISYSNGIATIDGLWDYGFHPKSGDTVSLTPAYADSRISINPAMQLMDYITSPTYGRGLNPTKDLNFESWLNTAKLCDTQSNVTTQMTSVQAVGSGSVYRYPSSGPILWQGTVVGTENDYVEFTNVLGKLTYAWNSWRTFRAGELMHVDNELYRITMNGVIPEKPAGPGDTFTNAGSVTLTKTNGTGPGTIDLKTDGNPVRAFKNGATIPGYSLYDADGVDFWRYLGWDEFSQRYVTQHQTNIIIDTSLPLFDNVNSLLEHFGGILRYSAGQYYLDLEEATGPISSEPDEPKNITADHIIGKIRLTDEGIRSAFNSLTAAYADPANKFESRNISFFNSDYLRADKNVPKKGTITVPGITNYYNTRLLADKTLNKSRYGLQISFNMSQRGTLLLAGQVIQLQYPRYSWEDKKFRILTLTHQEDATVDIVAEEYDDSFYGLSNISKQAASGLMGNTGYISGIGAPSDLQVTSVDTEDETNSAIALSWINSPDANNKNVATEIFSSFTDQLYVEIIGMAANTITTKVDHNLKVDEQITAINGVGGLDQGRTYFILAIPASNKLQLSETRGGPVLALKDDTYEEVYLQTAILTATVPVPATSHVDVFGGIDDRVEKFYWVRHKVVQAV